MKDILYWLPRILSILYIAFISLFALDVFGEPQWLLALFMHLIPSFILIILTVIAWNNKPLGGVAFITLGILTSVFFHLSPLVFFAPLVVIGLLFLI